MTEHFLPEPLRECPGFCNPQVALCRKSECRAVIWITLPRSTRPAPAKPIGGKPRLSRPKSERKSKSGGRKSKFKSPNFLLRIEPFQGLAPTATASLQLP